MAMVAVVEILRGDNDARAEGQQLEYLQRGFDLLWSLEYYNWDEIVP